MDELTYSQKYEVPVELTLCEFKVTYAGCGSHELSLKGETTLENAQALFDALKALPGIKP